MLCNQPHPRCYLHRKWMVPVEGFQLTKDGRCYWRCLVCPESLNPEEACWRYAIELRQLEPQKRSGTQARRAA